jgi:hypothetical protein
MEEYWPASSLSPAEKVARTANVVGLNMPRPLEEHETKQGGGKTWSELRQSEGQESGTNNENALEGLGLSQEGLSSLEAATRILEQSRGDSKA